VLSIEVEVMMTWQSTRFLPVRSKSFCMWMHHKWIQPICWKLGKLTVSTALNQQFDIELESRFNINLILWITLLIHRAKTMDHDKIWIPFSWLKEILFA
jgi:hypothetical protein